MKKITIEHNPPQDKLDKMGVKKWPVWSKEESEFPWTYDEDETAFLLEGHVVVTPENGEPVEIKAGDLVVFPAGMSCRWKILKKIRKHYKFG
jgi:hypothetical protein